MKTKTKSIEGQLAWLAHHIFGLELKYIDSPEIHGELMDLDRLLAEAQLAYKRESAEIHALLEDLSEDISNG